MFEHKDVLEALNNNEPLTKKIVYIHEVLKQRYTFIDRIAAAIYEAETDLVKTFLYSSGRDLPLLHYQAKLSESASLLEIRQRNRPRVVNDLSIFANGKAEHTRKLNEQGYNSSYTLPMYINSEFFGFIFFNSYQAAPFNEEVLYNLDVIGHLLTLAIGNELASIKNLIATVKTARNIAHKRDSETGCHLDRMSHYARLIARQLAAKHKLTDEFVEQIFLFSPLHDIGKISTPDNVLLKKGKLSMQEFEIMKKHTLQGREIIDQMMENFSLHELSSISMLRNIAELHHEAINGTGYPHGLQGDAIPIESRIVAVADVFDALTSQRPYKQAWSNKDTFNMLNQLAGIKFDTDCVSALENNCTEVEEIQSHFKENPIG